MPELREEGWYTDPFGLHEARWFSDGQPTKLVRDGATESYDDPPSEPLPEAPKPIVSSASRGADDLHRADETRPPGFDAEGARQAGEAAVAESYVPYPLHERP